MESTNWSQALSSGTCSVTQSAVTPVTSDGSNGIPAGVVTDSVTVEGTCSPAGATVAAMVAGAAQPLTLSKYCVIQDEGTAGPATGGDVCVGTTTVGSDPSYMAASYYRTASTSSFGHPELGSPSGSCAIGSLVINGHPEGTVTTGSFGAVIWGPISASQTWSSTWWQDNGGGSYSDFGTVCGTY
jgi:hypothetical protein